MPSAPSSRAPAGPGLLILASAVVLTFSACSSKEAAGPGRGKARSNPAVPVTVGTVHRRTVPVQIRAIGNAQPTSTVSIRPQVSGQIVEVHFREGQEVVRGQLLFTIDPRPFETALSRAQAEVGRQRAAIRQARARVKEQQAAVERAQAEVERTAAQLKNARSKEKRFTDLYAKKFVTQDQFEEVQTNATALAASVSAGKAAARNAQAAVRAAQAQLGVARAALRTSRATVEAAKLNLGYTRIVAPITGFAGTLRVHAGNVVQALERDPLVVIHQVRPIYVSFSVPERHLATIRKFNEESTIGVEAIPTGDDARKARGRLTFIENAVDTATGTIAVKATFANRELRLWPGQFVQVVMTLTRRPGTLVVASQAIQSGQKGTYVYLVGKDLTVKPRPVALGERVGDEIVVVKGLKAGERVVTDGQSRLRPGSKVAIRSSQGAAQKGTRKATPKDGAPGATKAARKGAAPDAAQAAPHSAAPGAKPAAGTDGKP